MSNFSVYLTPPPPFVTFTKQGLYNKIVIWLTPSPLTAHVVYGWPLILIPKRKINKQTVGLTRLLHIKQWPVIENYRYLHISIVFDDLLYTYSIGSLFTLIFYPSYGFHYKDPFLRPHFSGYNGPYFIQIWLLWPLTICFAKIFQFLYQKFIVS